MIAPQFNLDSALLGLAGGALIGLAAALMLLGAGRIAGVSGIAARASGLADEGMPRIAALAFLVGLPLGAAIMSGIGLVQRAHPPALPFLLVAGLLVGFGTRLGSGCTSGHGVCGMSRLSTRSLVATAVFIATGVATVKALRLTGIGPWS